MSATSKFKMFAAAAVLGVLTVPAMSYAQAQPGGGGGGGGGGNNGGGGGGRQRGGWDPAQMKQRMMDGIKEQLGTSDDEFAALQPKIEKVVDAQRSYSSGGSIRNAFGGGNRGGGGGGGGAGGGGGQGRQRGGGPGGGMTDTNSPVYKATQELQTVVEDKDAKPEDVKAKLEAYRAARTAAKAELTKAQDDLKGVLTAKQEAAMVEDGLLD